MLYDTYQIKKPIRLIELFAGYGSQALALKYLGVNFEHHKICEWATKSIQAYNDLHIRDYTDYSKELTQNDVIELLTSYGVSMDYNKPMTYNQIKCKGEKWQRDTYNNIIATNNLVNIQNAKAKDLNIVDTDKYDYILTYSFPCQDLSLAGKREGMSRGSGTRSGMLWEVERLLKECEELPQILVMENVPQVHGKGNMEYFQEWIMELEKLGYTSFYDNLNSKNFCIPQNRQRTFMISLLGKYNYKMPKKMKLKYRLKDMLEKEVSKKYYLSEKMIDCLLGKNMTSDFPRGDVFLKTLKNTNEKEIAATITCAAGQRPSDNFILIKEKTKEECTKVNDDYLGTYRFAQSDNFMKGKDRFIPNKEYIDTILTQCKEDVVTVGNYSPSGHNASRIVDSKGIAPTVMENHGTVTAVVEDYCIKKVEGNILKKILKDEVFEENEENKEFSYGADYHYEVEIKPKLIGGIGEKKSNGGTQYYQQDRIYDSEGIAMAHPANLPSGSYMYQLENLCIRKLTPGECFRLMGVKDEDFKKVNKNQSDSSLYHLAGDSIVTTCLMAIFGELLGVDYKTKINDLVNHIVKNN